MCYAHSIITCMLFIGGDGGGDVASNDIQVSVRVVDISKVIRP